VRLCPRWRLYLSPEGTLVLVHGSVGE
jgi:hypothetical protein